MIKITNGIDTFEVSKGAFDGIYSHQGYSKVEIEEVEDTNTNGDKTPENEDEKFCDELLETPLSNWNKDEIKKFCEIKGIDISGTKNAKEAIEIIKVALEQEQE